MADKGFVPYVFHGHTRPINYLCFNHDSDLLAVACSDNICSLWWAYNATPARVLEGHVGAISSVALTGLPLIQILSPIFSYHEFINN